MRADARPFWQDHYCSRRRRPSSFRHVFRGEAGISSVEHVLHRGDKGSVVARFLQSKVFVFVRAWFSIRGRAVGLTYNATYRPRPQHWGQPPRNERGAFALPSDLRWFSVPTCFKLSTSRVSKPTDQI